jgi:hypothetical protein
MHDYFSLLTFFLAVFFSLSTANCHEAFADNCGTGPCPELLATGQLGWGVSLNSLGEVFWSQGDQATGISQIFSSMRGQLTNDSIGHNGVAANNLGDMVWPEYTASYPNSYRVRGIIGGQEVTIIESQYPIYKVDINDRGEVVWVMNDGSSYSQIFSNQRGQLTNGSVYNNDPSINNQGDIVYTLFDPQQPTPLSNVYRLPAGSTTPVAVTSDTLEHHSPTINDNGEIVWIERDMSGSSSPLRIVSTIRGVLLSQINDIWSVDVNNCGTIAYTVYENGQASIYRLGSGNACVTYPGANETQEQATQISLGSIFTGLLDSSSNLVDWYRFDAVSGDSIHIKVNYDNRPPNALNIGLYDVNGNLISGPTTLAPLAIDTQAPYSGGFYLKVEAQGGRFGYTVSLSNSTNNCGAGPCPDLIATGQLGWGVSLNSLGEVFWSQGDQATGISQIFSSLRGQLTNDSIGHNGVSANNLGDMVWPEYTGSYPNSYRVRGVIGGQQVTVVESQYPIYKVDLNDRGEVVWVMQDGSSYSQIFSNIRGQLTSGNAHHNDPSINNQGDIVYTLYDPQQSLPSSQVYRLQAGSTTPVLVTSDTLDHRSPAINDNGEIVWIERDMSASTPLSRIVSTTRGVLLSQMNDIWSVDLNNCGTIAYMAYENGQTSLYRLGSGSACVTYPGANETQEQATQISLGSIFTGLLDSSSNLVDWYRFDAVSGDSIHIKVNYDNRPPNALNIGLYDAQGNLVSGPTTMVPFAIDTQASYSGGFYLKVEAQGGRFGYTVSLSNSTNNCGAGPCPDLVTTGQFGWGVSLNSLGEVFWSQGDQATGISQIFSSMRGQLTNDSIGHNGVAANNLGDMVWPEYTASYPNSYRVRGIIGGQEVTIIESQYPIYKVDINDRGEVVWVMNDGSSYSQIFSNQRGQLTNGSVYNNDPSINNQGDIVYTLFDPQQPTPLSNVYRLPAGSTTPVAVTSDTLEHHSPTINDNGEIVWIERDMSGSSSPLRIVSTIRGVLLSQINDIWSVDVNNCGTIAYTVYENGQASIYRLGSGNACVTYPGANETQEQATQISLGSIFTGLLDSSSNLVDWYRFDAVSGDSIHIKVNYDNRPPNALNIGLYDVNGNLISGPTTLAPLAIDTQAPYSGGFYLKVEAQGGRFGYTVSLSNSTNNCGAGPCPDLIATGQLGWGVSLNSLGEVFWSQGDQATGISQIFSSLRGQLTNDSIGHNGVSANNLGDMVWPEYTGSYPNSYRVRGVIGGQQVTVVESQYPIYKVDLNDRGEVVWVMQDGSSYSQIFSNIRGQLTSGNAHHNDPSINNQGDIVYTLYDPQQSLPSSQVYRLQAGSTTPVLVTSDTLDHRSPAINDNGEIVWIERDMSASTPLSRIVSTTRGVLLSQMNDIWSVDLNNCGTIAYMAYENGQTSLYRLGSGSACVTYPGANETQEQATQISLGSIFTGLLDSSSNLVDWYRFDAVSGDSIHIKVNYDNRPPNALNIGLYDAEGNLLSGPTATNPIAIDTQASYSGSYYLKVELQSGRFGYTVSLSNSTNNCGTGTCPDLVATGQLGWGLSLNSLGEVVWTQGDQTTGLMQIFSSTRGQLTTDSINHNSPAVNDLGDMVWVEYSQTGDYLLRGIIAGQQVTVATSQGWIGRVDLNDRGEVVWAQQDNSGYGQIFSNIRGQLTTGTVYSNDPSINNQGEIVYTLYDPQQQIPSSLVYRLQAGSTTPVLVTNDTLDHRSPTINDNGEIVWIERDMNSSAPLSRIVSTTRGVQLSAASDIWSVDLNNCGTIAYMAYENNQTSLYRLGSGSACVMLPTVSITSPTGVISGNNQPVLIYTVSEGTVVVKVDGVIVNKISGETFDMLTEGPHTVRVEATNSAGITGSAEVTFTIDLPPTVSISTPSAGIINNNAPLLSYTTSNGSVVVKVDGAVVSVISGNTLGLLVDGTHTVRVEATDAGGTGFAERSFTVDTVAPTVAITSPVAGITNTLNPLLNFNVSDGTVAVKVDGVIVNKTSGNALDTLTEGIHTVRVEAMDTAGNTGAAQVTFTVDLPPTVSISTPVAGITNNNAPLLTYTVSNGSVVVKVDGAMVSKESGSTLGPLADGTHTVRVEATDAGGIGFAERTFAVDTIAPTVSLSSPASGTTSDNQPLLTYTVSDGTVTVKVDGIVVNKVSGNRLNTLGNGSHTVRVESVDAAGNIGFSSVTFTVNAVAVGTDDFETGNLSLLSWVTSGNAPWAAKTTTKHGGAYSAEAPQSITDNQSSSLEVTLDCNAGNVSFWYSVSSEANYDFLTFYVDGVQKGRWSGTVSWTQISFAVTAGIHNFKWVYSKDGSVSTGSDTAWIDDIAIPASGRPLPPVLTKKEGFETGTMTYLPWVTSGNGLWSAKTTTRHNGSYSAEAPVSITDSQSATMETTMNCATGTISFWYSVSSEANYDYLRFYIDGVQKGQWSGSVAWTQVTFPVTAGSHTFKWAYSKDSSVSVGSDTAWVDDIAITIP